MQFSEYGKFPASKRPNAALVRLLVLFNFFVSPFSRVRANKKGGHEAARRGATRVRTHTWLPNESLFEGPWGATMQNIQSEWREATCSGAFRRVRVRFFPAHVKIFFDDFMR